MGNALFQSNYIDIETNCEEGESSIIDTDSPKKEKYNFYLDRDFLSNSDLDEKTMHLIKQKYAINKINLIIKHIKKFLRKKKATKKIFKSFAFLLNKKVLSKINSAPITNNPLDELKINAKSKSDFIKEMNDDEQKKSKLLKSSIILNSENFNKISGSIKLVKLGSDSYILSKLSPDKKIKYVKTFFGNGDLLKSYYDKTYNIHYGIYNYYKLGTIYEGDWKEDKKTGLGIEKMCNGDLYEGEFKNGKKNGIGVYYWNDNSIYFGEWLDNRCHGYGVFKNGDKSKYQGQFFFNKRDGYGELIKYNIGTFYFGFWSNNKRKGFGVEFSHRENENCKIYIGYWNRDYRHGFGMVLNKNYKSIYGVWKKNQLKDLFKSKEEFDNKKKNYVDAHLMPFFNKAFEEYEEIFKKMIDSTEFKSNYFD